MADRPKQDRDAQLPTVTIGNRVLTAVNYDLAERIVERIAEGETLSQITKEAGMPHRTTFYRWVLNDLTVARAYHAAKELSAHNLEEEALDVARFLKNPGAELSAARVRALDVALTQLRWSAGKRNPRVYSEKSQVNVTVPIQINTNLDLGDGAPARGEELPNIYTLKARQTVALGDPSKETESEQTDGTRLDGTGGTESAGPFQPLLDLHRQPRAPRPPREPAPREPEPIREPTVPRKHRKRGQYGD